jgi:tetratricopeptide (TPR) repeat protein
MAVEYMVKQRGPEVLPRVLDLLAQGKRTEAAVAEAMGVPFDRFLSDWKKFMAARPMPRGGDHELERLRFRDDPKHGGAWSEWSEMGDERARGFARLGEIFRARSRWAAARIEYAKAYKRVGPRVAILANQYALAAMMSGGKAEAEKVLGEALEWSPDYPALNVRMARLLLDRGDAPHAREHLLHANRQDPFDPEIHAGLAKALEVLGDPTGASREAEFGRILSGGTHP